MSAETIIGWCLIGLIAGALAKVLIPGRDPGGMATTILLGIAGAFLGGMVGRLAKVELLSTRSGAIVAGTVGAVVLLIVYRAVLSRRSA